MTSIKELAVLLTKALEEKDIATFRRCRNSIVFSLADNDYMINSTDNLFKLPTVSDNLLVGKSLTILLSDMSKSGLIYRRVVVSAMYCLIKTIINDRYGYYKETTLASIYLLILFYENQDFIGGEYIAQGVRNNAEVAAQQFIGMTCVFYWMYKLSSFHVVLDSRTDTRLKKALNNLLLEMPDEITRRKVVNFEYDNFDAMSKSMPVDFELKYPGIPLFEPDVVFSKIEAMFGNTLTYFQANDKGPSENYVYKTSQHPSTNQNNVKHTTPTSDGSGCLSITILVIIISLFSII